MWIRNTVPTLNSRSKDVKVVFPSKYCFQAQNQEAALKLLEAHGITMLPEVRDQPGVWECIKDRYRTGKVESLIGLTKFLDEMFYRHSSTIDIL